MWLYKRGKIWWVGFVSNGRRYRLSLETTDKRVATTLAKKRIAEAEQGKLSTSSVDFAKLAFGEAADKYLESRRLEVQPSTHAKEKQVLKKLREYFQSTRLNRITAEQILGYREWRSSQKVGPSIINMEVGIVRRMLKRAKRWHFVADEIKPLKEPRTIGKAMLPEQKQKLLDTASQKPEWETAYFAAMIALNTTMRGCEIKGLRWSDIDLFDRTLTIRKSKTEAGERVIPLTEEAYSVFLRLYERSQLFGAVESSHYVFASFKPTAKFDGKKVVRTQMSNFDPTRPLASWKKGWRTLTEKAGLKGLRFHDLRHHAITELAEAGVSEQVIMEIAGHVDPRMLKRYSHIRMEAKRNALEAFSKKKQEGCDTVQGTIQPKIPVYSDVSIASIEGSGIGACGFEPQTPTVSKKGFAFFDVSRSFHQFTNSLVFKAFCQSPSPVVRQCFLMSSLNV